MEGRADERAEDATVRPEISTLVLLGKRIGTPSSRMPRLRGRAGWLVVRLRDHVLAERLFVANRSCVASLIGDPFDAVSLGCQA